ncbi:MAG: hypothetical protein WC803_12055 [Sphingomonas sp.]|jgi:hypothetical protein
MVLIGLATACLASCGQSDPKASAKTTGDWVLQRATMSGACHVKEAPSLPNLGDVLATKPDKVAICKEAKARDTDDAGDKTKCFTYTRGAVDTCKAAGINLP